MASRQKQWQEMKNREAEERKERKKNMKMEIKYKCWRWKVMNCEKWFAHKLGSRLNGILSVSHKNEKQHENFIQIRKAYKLP